jgi:hypothetical protein
MRFDPFFRMPLNCSGFQPTWLNESQYDTAIDMKQISTDKFANSTSADFDFAGAEATPLAGLLRGGRPAVKQAGPLP